MFVTLGDLNGDSILDLVTAGHTGVAGEWARVRLGNGNGTFRAATSYAMGPGYSSGVTLGDLNGDGFLDLVTAARGGGGRATVRLGNGNGTFGAATSYAMESGYSSGVTLGDLNGDGVLDLATVGNDGGGGRATVRLGNGNGSFGAATSYVMHSDNASSATLGDLNGDGVLDIITAGTYDYEGTVSIRLGNTSDGVAPILPFSLETIAAARQALPVFKQRRDQLAAQRGDIGSHLSRIAVASSVLQITSENFAAAESRIRDADTAQESANLTRLNILQQTATAVLGQANQQPALALALLTRQANR